MHSHKLSIVVPLYNEGTNCEEGIKNILKNLDESNQDYEIILVNNGSKDNTKAIIEKFRTKNNNIKTIHLDKNQGYGGGILSGLENSVGDYIGWTVSDGEIDGKDLVNLYKKMLSTNADLGKTFRIKRNDGLKRWILSKGYNLFITCLFFTKFKDINGYPKILKKSMYDKLNIYHKDWFIDTEIMLKAKQRDMLICEIPTVFKKRKGGKSHVRLTAVFQFLINITKIRFFNFKK